MNHQHFISILVLTLLFCASAQNNSETQPQTVQLKLQGKVVQIQPIALDVIIPQFQKIVVFMVNQQTEQIISHYERQVRELQQQLPQMDTLFTICNVSNDVSNKLQKYGRKEGIKVITNVHHYQLPLNELYHSDPSSFFQTQFVPFYKKIVNPILSKISVSEIDKLDVLQSYYVVVKVVNDSQIDKTSAIYQRIYDYLQLFGVQLVIVQDSQADKVHIGIYRKGQLQAQYASSAINQLYNFAGNKIQQSQINDLVDFINIQTINQVSHLNQNNYFRVFGNSLQTQMLLVYPQANKQQLQGMRQEFRKAAEYNKKEQLKFERVIFAQSTKQFLKDYFTQQLLEKEQKYKIIVTKTHYSNFQLRKFIFKSEQVTKENLIQFLEDVRMKKVDPKYKSQSIPNNKDKKIRKIVGNTFISEIFEKPDKSVIVLFIDSKDLNSQVISNLQAFVQKYHGAYHQNMDIGIFDLAKNQHQSLTIKTAPELVLFEKSNKKKPKFFKGRFEPQIIKNWINYEVKDITIPENYGEPILPLGPSDDL